MYFVEDEESRVDRWRRAEQSVKVRDGGSNDKWVNRRGGADAGPDAWHEEESIGTEEYRP